VTTTATATTTSARPRAPRRSIVLPGLLLGLGLGGFVDGILLHQILGIHHVRDDTGAPLGWDLAFLASGVLLVAAGWLLAR
jgi:uncharacterized membrane protein